MRVFRSILRDYPAFTRMIAILLSLNLVTLLAVRLFLRDGRPDLYLLGDSCIGNYRMDPGTRLQDFLQRMEPNLCVHNWAEPGSSPLDFLLLVCKGKLISDQPYKVIITMAPDKLMGGPENRLDEDGANLRWISFDRIGLQIWQALTPRERNVAVVQKTSLFLYGFTDLGRALWISYWQWPHERHAMRHASHHRREKIKRKVEEIGKTLETTPIGSDADFASQIRAHDAKLLLDVLRDDGIEPLVIVHPYGNPFLLAHFFSPRALAKRDSIDLRLCDWLSNQHVSYLNLDSPKELRNFPDSVWDDNAHMKAAQVFYYLSQRIAGWLSANYQNLPHRKPAASHAMIQTPGNGIKHD